MPEYITYAEAKNKTLNYLKSSMAKMPPEQRTRPVISFDMNVWSLPEMINQVTMDTETGRRYVYFYVGSLKTFLILG